MTEQSVRGRIADVCAWCLYDNEHKTMFDPATVATNRIIAIVREALLSDGAIHDLTVGTHGCGGCDNYPDKESVCWTSCVKYNTRGMNAALDAAFGKEEQGAD